MANQVGEISVQINQSSGTGQTQTCFGLPGALGANAIYCDVNATATVRIFDDSSVQVAMSGTISRTGVLSNNYAVAMFICPHDWDFTYTTGGLTYPSDCIQIADAVITVPVEYNDGRNRGTFTWNVDSGFHHIGQLTDFGASDTGDDGYLWCSGTGTYGGLNDPIYPDPVRITVPGFMAYLDYYPGSIRKSGRFMSCNRPGGKASIRKSGSWRDVKNVEVGSGTNHGFYMHNSQWTKLPKIGATS